MFRKPIVSTLFIMGLLFPAPVWAGNIFLTGHDPDFHAASDAGAANLLTAGLEFATGGTTFTATEKFLFVTARPADIVGGVPTGHLDPVAIGLVAGLSLVEGTHFDVAHAGAASGLTLDLSLVDFSNYTAIAISSSFGGLLRRAELDGLIARKDDITDFVNAGGGLFASSECDVSFATSCGVDLIDPAGGLFGYLPITAISVPPAEPFTVTAFGFDTFGLVNADVSAPTHASFADSAGLNIVDTDNNGVPTTLAGNVLIGDDGFVPIVDINIHPTSFPSPVNVCTSGLGASTPVTIWGSDTFDVTEIDLTTLLLGNNELKTKGGTPNCSVGDVGTPDETSAEIPCDGSDIACDGALWVEFSGAAAEDGFDDLTCHFFTAQLTGDVIEDAGTFSLPVTGETCDDGAFVDGLYSCANGTPIAFEGTDEIKLNKKCLAEVVD